jgi:hypothetical protein
MPKLTERAKGVPALYHEPSKNGEKELLSLGEEPDLIAAIESDIAAMGLVRETNNGLLCYLAFSSRVLPRPVSVVVRGPTSVGKTTILQSTAQLFPDEVKVEIMDATDASMFRTPIDYFMHKIYLAGERRHAKDDAAKDREFYIRQLISEGRINRMLCVKDTAEEWVSRRFQREGPIAYAETTTSKSVFEENLNRMFQLYPDSSRQMNRAVMEAMAAQYDPEPGDDKTDIRAIIDRNHEFQMDLQYRGLPLVRIPYAKFLSNKMPPGKPAVRRAFGRVLSVIECLVTLQAHQREERNGFLGATVADFAIARRLLSLPLEADLKIRGVWKRFARLKEAVSKATFSTPEIADAMKFKDKMATSRFINDSLGASLLREVEKAKKGRGGRPATYAFTELGEGDDEPTVLPPVAEVQRFMNK